MLHRIKFCCLHDPIHMLWKFTRSFKYLFSNMQHLMRSETITFVGVQFWPNSTIVLLGSACFLLNCIFFITERSCHAERARVPYFLCCCYSNCNYKESRINYVILTQIFSWKCLWYTYYSDQVPLSIAYIIHCDYLIIIT